MAAGAGTPADPQRAGDLPAGHCDIYEPVETIAADEFRSKLLLQTMEREWETLRRRYEEFHEFWEMVNRARDDSAA